MLFSEFAPQEAIVLIYPFKGSDWDDSLSEITQSYEALVLLIAKYQAVIIVAKDPTILPKTLISHKGITIITAEYNDTWARDTLPLCVRSDGKMQLLSFEFNGWGNKYECALDNALAKSLFEKGVYDDFGIDAFRAIDICLEGGGIDSNGEGLVLVNSRSFSHRNGETFAQIKERLSSLFDAKILVINEGFLQGDDTDSHIDTLARFINPTTILYTVCEDSEDVHFRPLQLMERELEALAQKEGLTLVPIALPAPKYYPSKYSSKYQYGRRLPATYINFIAINDAIIIPTYRDAYDTKALEIFQKHFPDHTICPFDASIFIRQNGSLHCATMNIFRQG